MSLQSVTVHIPDRIYNRLKRRAEQSRRSVEDELLEVVAAAMPVSEELSPDLAEAISHLDLLETPDLWRAARGRLSEDSAAQMESLHVKSQREGLTQAEEQTLAGLVRQYERVMLVRAQAAFLLKERGQDISELTPEK